MCSLSTERTDVGSNVVRNCAGLVLLLTILGAAGDALAQCPEDGVFRITGVRGRITIDPGNDIQGEELILEIDSVGSHHLEFAGELGRPRVTVDATVHPDGNVSGVIRFEPLCLEGFPECFGFRRLFLPT